jgi:hypothetical protein
MVAWLLASAPGSASPAARAHGVPSQGEGGVGSDARPTAGADAGTVSPAKPSPFPAREPLPAPPAQPKPSPFPTSEPVPAPPVQPKPSPFPESTPEPVPAPAATGIPTPAGAAVAPEAKPEPSYDDLVRRIEALEKASDERTPPPAPRSTAGAFTQNRFNPDLSIVTDLAFVGTSITDRSAQTLAIPGYLEESDRTGKLRGINFNYLELAFNAAVDPYFDFFGVVTVEPGGATVEEAYVDTRHLRFGFQLRIGKFLSAFGRLNGMHKHFWDFYDQPLVYEAFMGSEGFKNPGLRVSWTAPVDFLLQFSFEVFQGVSDESPTFNAVGYDLTATDGTHSSSTAPFVPALYVGSLKTSFDFGDHVFLLGASAMYGHSTQTRIEGLPTDMAFSAPGTVLYDAELTYKYLISSYRSITWQSEYLGRLSSGDLALASNDTIHAADKKQGGFYSQLVWRFDEPGRWRVGARFDLLAQNSLTIDGVGQPLDNMLQRYTAMLEFSPTEFSRFRLQYAFDRSRTLNGSQKDVHEVLLQMNIAVGPHGAHSF